MKKIVVLFGGAGTNLEYIFKYLHQKDLIVSATITNNPQAGGIAISQKANIPVVTIEPKDYPDRESYDAKLVENINGYNPDLVVMAGFMRILTPVFIENIKAINLHPSLLPRHKGLHAIERSYKDPFDEGGVTVHWVSSELDGGEIIVQKSISKIGLSLEKYTEKIRIIEKEALYEAIIFALKNM